jgi:hypothetical protein
VGGEKIENHVKRIKGAFKAFLNEKKISFIFVFGSRVD